MRFCLVVIRIGLVLEIPVLKFIMEDLITNPVVSFLEIGCDMPIIKETKKLMHCIHSLLCYLAI